MSKRPILVTGSHRSGSTWVASMLNLSSGSLMVNEPFNVGGYALDGLATRWFTYAPALPQNEARNAFSKVVEGKTNEVFSRRKIQHWIPATRRGRLVIKDPIACLSSEWLANEFDLEMVVLVRHPAAFAASLKRLNLTFPFSHFLEQQVLLDEYLAPYQNEIEDTPEHITAQAALLWKCLYTVLFDYVDRNPGWIVRTHEEISLSPISKLRELYEILGLKWTPSVERRIRQQTGEKNPVAAPEGVLHQMRRDSTSNVDLWRSSLSAKEIEHIYNVTYGLARRYYSEDDW